jgi:hypothetical protein
MPGRGELTDAAWAVLAPLLPQNGKRGDSVPSSGGLSLRRVAWLGYATAVSARAGGGSPSSFNSARMDTSLK